MRFTEEQQKRLPAEEFEALKESVVINRHDAYKIGLALGGKFSEHKTLLLHYYLNDEKFDDVDYETKRTVALNFLNLPASYHWLCHHGNNKDLHDIAPYVFKSEDIKVIAENPYLDIQLIDNFMWVLDSDTRNIFISEIPVNKLSIDLLMLLTRRALKGEKPFVMRRLRELSGFVDESIPDEWVLQAIGRSS